MIKKLIGKIWGKIPPTIRLKIIRATQRKFTVSVAAIITNPEGKVLLVEHILRPEELRWGIPGGFIKPCEQPEEAICREIFEETGLHPENLKMIRVRTLNRHLEILFRAQGCGDAKVKSREIISVGWFNVSEMPSEMSEIQKSLVKKVLHCEI